VKLDQPTTSISLNTASPLRLTNAVAVLSLEGRRLSPRVFTHDEAKDLMSLEFEEELPKGGVILALSWVGSLEDTGSLGKRRILSLNDLDNALTDFLLFQFYRVLPHSVP